MEELSKSEVLRNLAFMLSVAELVKSHGVFETKAERELADSQAEAISIAHDLVDSIVSLD